MAISRGHRFPVEFAEVFPQGLVLVGEVSPDNEFQSREDRAAGRPARQRVDEVTGKRQWKATVTDPDERNAKRASFEVTFLADVQPVPTTTEVLPGVRPVELDGLTAEPRVAGNGEFKWRVVLPLCKPALATLGILTFLASWNNFLWPLVAASTEDKYTLPVALALYSIGQNRTDYDLLLAGAVVLVLPVLLVFILLQRHFVRGIATTGLK